VVFRHLRGLSSEKAVEAIKKEYLVDQRGRYH